MVIFRKKNCKDLIASVFSILLFTASMTLAVMSVDAVASVDGKGVYKKHCAPCHGEKGKGFGAVAHALYPKPRDFAIASYKIRSTPSGSLPTNEDLIRTISVGMSGTSMIGWKGVLEDEEIESLIPVLKGFSEIFEDEKPAPTVKVGRPIRSSLATIVKGKEIYTKMGCWKCHGKTGKGDGPSSDTLEDDWKIPIQPYDFTKGTNLKGGNSDKDIYLRFTTGMSGTPMPSFADSLNEEERWYLVHFVKSLMWRTLR
jgi:cytochrome c oxidase cbb3-type subunit 2